MEYHRHTRFPVAASYASRKAARTELAAGNTDDDFVFDAQRRAGDAVAKHGIGNLCLPEEQPCPGVDGNDRRIERAHEYAIAEQLDSYERIKDSEGILGAWLCLPRGGAGSFLLPLQRCSCASGWPLPECARYRRAKGVRRSLAEFQLPTGQPYE